MEWLLEDTYGKACCCGKQQCSASCSLTSFQLLSGPFNGGGCAGGGWKPLLPLLFVPSEMSAISAASAASGRAGSDASAL